MSFARSREAGFWRLALNVTMRIIAAIAIAIAPVTLEAQGGALFLLAPFGGRSVGQGEAVMADTSMGTEGIWWNAASMARLAKPEFAMHFSKAFTTSGMLAIAAPSRVLGTFAMAFHLVDAGSQDATDSLGQYIGILGNQNWLAAASYATPIGKHFSAGLTYKFVATRFVCSCVGNLPAVSGSTNALDVGMQYIVSTSIPVIIGAGVRNLGSALQVKDEPQADPLPKVTQVGMRVQLPFAALKRNNATLDVMADYLYATSPGGSSIHAGTVLAYKDLYSLRGGLIHTTGRDASNAFSLGLGVRVGSGINFDFARRFDTVSSQLQDSPTYVSLRWAF